MPIRTPPQHNTVHPPGQYIPSFYTEKLDWSKTDMGYKSHPKTLGDVIDNVMFQEKALAKKKQSFEEWFTERYLISVEEANGKALNGLRECWKAAQENK